MKTAKQKMMMAAVKVAERGRRLAGDQRGITVSSIMLIGALAAALSALGLAALATLTDIGTTIDGVTLTN